MLMSDAFPSRFLSAADVGDKEFALLISHCEIEQVGDEDKPVLHFTNAKKPMVLNPTNWRLIEAIVGSGDTDDWAGRKITVFVDRTVMFKGKPTPGIRVKAPSKSNQPAPTQPPKPAPQSLQEAGDMMDDEIPF